MKIISKTLRLSAFFILFSTLFSSCADGRTAMLVFNPQETELEPGLTSEITLTAIFVDTDSEPKILSTDIQKPGKAHLKQFTDPPVITVSNPGLKILSAEPVVSGTGIKAGIIILASKELISGSSGTITANWGNCSAETALKIKKNPLSCIDSDGVVTDPAAYDVLVNKQRRMPADYVPPDLVRVEVPTILSFDEVNHLRQAASDALNEMFAAARTEKGYELLARSGYRSYKTQVMLYDLNVREYGEEQAARISAQPGTSEHMTGLAMDISSPEVNYQLTKAFGETEQGLWVAANAHRFGFIIRYPEGKEDITGYDYEPWHLRWLGPELAEEIYTRNLTFEEYFLN
ncbi:MAG: M15 family metallopeptidase [Spirochaetales bacterium]|uniref:M15 family metallopeptidase n=1 Tax=Candidatus Thalassospirochaeta sargassi TaxID=3119039 RepID=A0AAJ1IDC7_9SPIO|nr:M15 family metallopeptidase [Spirochaetales bacterium]